MYCYIYDIFISQKKYEKQLFKIEATLTDLGIMGKVYKLNVLKNLENIIEEALADGVKNIIAVGNDQTVSKVADQIINKNMVMGVIPLGEPSLLASLLGIRDPLEACQIVSARKVAKLDIGKINGQYFLLSVETPNQNIVFDFKNYNINPLTSNQAVGLYNLNIDNLNFNSNPEDGVIEAVFVPKEPSWWQKIFKATPKVKPSLSVFPVKSLTIKHKKKPASVLIDRHKTLKTPLEVQVLPKKLQIIVGKQRMFG